MSQQPLTAGTPIANCMNALQAAVQSVSELEDKMVFVYSEDDLIDKIKGLTKYPGVGILYEGMRSEPELGRTAKVGVSAIASFALILIDQTDTPARTDQRKVNSFMYLEDIRIKLMATRSPTGHFWRFLAEAPAAVKGGRILWFQRWVTPIQLPPANQT